MLCNVSVSSVAGKLGCKLIISRGLYYTSSYVWCDHQINIFCGSSEKGRPFISCSLVLSGSCLKYIYFLFLNKIEFHSIYLPLYSSWMQSVNFFDRFHVLQEFDEGKRSCRRRLAGHNRRRRKTHPDVSVVNEGSLNDQRDSNYLLMSLLRILTNLHCKYLWHPKFIC